MYTSFCLILGSSRGYDTSILCLIDNPHTQLYMVRIDGGRPPRVEKDLCE